jgi:hypothetical protein
MPLRAFRISCRLPNPQQSGSASGQHWRPVYKVQEGDANRFPVKVCVFLSWPVNYSQLLSKPA